MGELNRTRLLERDRRLGSALVKIREERARLDQEEKQLKQWRTAVRRELALAADAQPAEAGGEVGSRLTDMRNENYLNDPIDRGEGSSHG